MLRKITNLLKTWEGCKLNGETSEEILTLIEEAGMLPPGHLSESGEWHRDYVYEWEKEDEQQIRR
jgi:hypothetical protein